MVIPPERGHAMLLLNNVREDSDLASDEKEFSLTSTKTDDEFTIFTDIGSVITSVIRNPTITITEIRIKDDGWMDPDEYDDGDGPIVGAKGTVPKGALKIRETARNTNRDNRIVSKG